MKSAPVFIFVSLLMIQCTQGSPETKTKELPTRYSATWVYESLAGDFRRHHLIIHKVQTDSGYLFRACEDTARLTGSRPWRRNDCDSTNVVESENDRWEFWELRENFLRDTLYFLAEGHQHYRVQGKTYDTYRFSRQNPPMDGQLIRYWEPSLGFFLAWSPDWGDVSYLTNHEGIDSLALAQLIQSVKQDTLFFTRGIINE
jgi:hypothetical protein